TEQAGGQGGDGRQLEPARMHGRDANQARYRRPLSAGLDSIPAIVTAPRSEGPHDSTTNVRSDAYASLDPRRGRLPGLADRDALLGQGPRGRSPRQLRPQALGRGDG